MHRPPTRRRRLTVLAIGVTTALSLTACGSPSDDAGGQSASPSASHAPEGVVDRKTAASIVDDYEKANNKANATRDAKLLGTVEAGQVHEQSKADYQLWPTFTEKRKKEYTTPFFYRDREYYIPAAGSGATWFAVTARSGKDLKKAPRGLLVFDKVDGRYKMTAALELKGQPKIALDQHGFAVPADPSKKVGTLAPTQLGERYEDFFETGGKEAKQYIASTEDSRESTKVYNDRNKGKTGPWTTTSYAGQKPSHPAVYALKLAGGGVLAVFPTAHTEETLLKPAYIYDHKITPGPQAAVFNSTPRIAVINTYEGQGLAELKPQKKARVTELEYRLTGSK
jgi:hypothetical protein